MIHPTLLKCLRQVLLLLAQWTVATVLQPLIDAFTVVPMATVQDSDLLTRFERLYADHALDGVFRLVEYTTGVHLVLFEVLVDWQSTE